MKQPEFLDSSLTKNFTFSLINHLTMLLNSASGKQQEDDVIIRDQNVLQELVYSQP